MRSIRATFLTIAVVASLYMGVAPRCAAAQVTGNTVSIPVQYHNSTESISAAVTGANTFVDLMQAGSPASAVTVTTTYSLVPANHSSGIKAAFWFATPAAALTSPSGSPASEAAGNVASYVNINNLGFGTAVACNASPTGIPGGAGGAACFNGTLVAQGSVNSNINSTATAAIALGFFTAPSTLGNWDGVLLYQAWAP